MHVPVKVTNILLQSGGMNYKVRRKEIVSSERHTFLHDHYLVSLPPRLPFVGDRSDCQRKDRRDA